VRPYYIVPEGKVGHDAFAVIRETIRSMDKVAIARVVLTNREHIIALAARGKGLVGMLLRYPYEIRDENEYFDGIQDVKVSRRRRPQRGRPRPGSGARRDMTGKSYCFVRRGLYPRAQGGQSQRRRTPGCR
jgi:Ku70/Ku80 beta-barrel domain